jgi:hypothetical protein
MKLAEQQKLLADLYTNPEIRDRYFIENKENLDKNEIAIFAESLIRKRLNVVKSCLPLSFAIRGNLLAKLFVEYASFTTIKGFHIKHQLDIFAFYKTIINKPVLENDFFIKEILRYETFNLRCQIPGKQFIFLYSRHLFPWANEKNISNTASLKGKVVILFYRFSAHGKGKRIVWRFPLLLELFYNKGRMQNKL